jgi:hypothetical protein
MLPISRYLLSNPVKSSETLRHKECTIRIRQVSYYSTLFIGLRKNKELNLSTRLKVGFGDCLKHASWFISRTQKRKRKYDQFQAFFSLFSFKKKGQSKGPTLVDLQADSVHLSGEEEEKEEKDEGEKEKKKGRQLGNPLRNTLRFFFFVKQKDEARALLFLAVDLGAQRIGPSNLETTEKDGAAFFFFSGSERETRAPPHLIDKCVETERAEGASRARSWFRPSLFYTEQMCMYTMGTRIVFICSRKWKEHVDKDTKEM